MYFHRSISLTESPGELVPFLIRVGEILLPYFLREFAKKAARKIRKPKSKLHTVQLTSEEYQEILEIERELKKAEKHD